MLLSIGLWFATAFFINSFTLLDFDWYEIFNRLVMNGTFWMTLLLLVVAVYAKDLYLYGLERDMNFQPYHILQEVRML